MLHEHQINLLVSWLSREEFKGLSADEAFQAIQRPPMALRAHAFLAASKMNRIKAKHRKPHMVEVGDVYASGFPTGLPGIPNIIRRADFDQAWARVK